MLVWKVEEENSVLVLFVQKGKKGLKKQIIIVGGETVWEDQRKKRS